MVMCTCLSPVCYRWAVFTSGCPICTAWPGSWTWTPPQRLQASTSMEDTHTPCKTTLGTLLQRWDQLITLKWGNVISMGAWAYSVSFSLSLTFFSQYLPLKTPYLLDVNCYCWLYLVVTEMVMISKLTQMLYRFSCIVLNDLITLFWFTHVEIAVSVPQVKLDWTLIGKKGGKNILNVAK